MLVVQNIFIYVAALVFSIDSDRSLFKKSIRTMESLLAHDIKHRGNMDKLMEGSNETVTNPFLKPSKLFVADSSPASRSILRPSVLTATAEKLRTDKPTTTIEVANPFATMTRSAGSTGSMPPSSHSLASNPFLKVPPNEPPEPEEEAPKEIKECKSPPGTLAAAAEVKMREVAANGSAVRMNPTLPAVNVTSVSGGFIFGKNISERVVQAKDSEDETTEEDKEDTADEEEKEEDDEEGATFSAIAAAGEGQSDATESKKSLTESAQEYQARQTRPEFDEVEVLTGEEGESNVLHLICRAFLYDRENNKWVERGRGFLRLNDANPPSQSRLRSRVIFRLQGSLKVVVNTPVWSGMRVEQGDEKRIRLTAQMPDGVRILLFQLNTSNEAHHLHSALSSRILQLRQQEGEDGELPQDDPSMSSPTDELRLGPDRKRRLRWSVSDDEADDEAETRSRTIPVNSEVAAESKEAVVEEDVEGGHEKRPRLMEKEEPQP